MEILAFVLVSTGIIIIPGPNVLVIVSTSLAQGKLRGLQTVAGTSCAMILQLVAAALGTAGLVSVLASGLLWIKWLGVAYLICLGISYLRKCRHAESSGTGSSAIGSFQRGFWVSLTNPKTILFFSAYMPQFVSSTGSYLSDVAILSVIFLGLAVLLDSGYAILSGKLGSLISRHYITRYNNGISGVLFLGAGVLLGMIEVARK